MKNLKRFLCIMLAASMICLLPGMTYAVSAVQRELASQSETEDLAAVTGASSVAQPMETGRASRDLSDQYQSGIFTAFSTDSNLTLASATTAETSPDMMRDLRKVNPAFSIQSSTNEEIDLNTGSLNLSYPLASMKGINGMDLSLSLNYSSVSANTKDRGYTDYDEVLVGYHIWYTVEEIYTSPEGIETDKFLYLEYDYVSLGDWDDYTDWLESGPYVTEYEDGSTCSKNYQYYTHESVTEYHYKSTTAERPISAAENGLGYGWSFDIPHIKKITNFDEEGQPMDYYRTIVLDSGKGLTLDGDVLCDFIITESRVSNGANTVTAYTDYQYAETAENVGGQSASYVLSYKDGTKYYFDENDLCIGKADRFGNRILYAYTNGKLTSLADDFGRSITLTWGTNDITITASDGASAYIVLASGGISSVSYNSAETWQFTYSTQNAVFGDQQSVIPYVLLTEVSHPNQCVSVYEYDTTTVDRPDGTNDQVFQVKKRYDTVSGTQKNILEYAYRGNYLSDYSVENALFVQNHSEDNIWTQNGIDYDVYAIISNYSTTVSDGISETTYRFNPNGYCNSIEVKESGILLSVTESLYEGDNLIAVRETLSDSAGDAMSYFTVYTYDTLKNIISAKKFQSGSAVYYEETAQYNNPYSLITSSSVNGIVTDYTYSADGKTLSAVEIKEGAVVREKVEYTYLANGNIKTEKNYILPSSTTVTTTYHYGANDTGIFPTSSVTDSIKDFDGNAKESITLSATYDTAGRILSETDGNGNTTSYTYDLRGRLIRTDYADGTYETITYDIANNRTTECNRAGYTQVQQYDENGNLISVKDGENQVLASYIYDVRGRVLSERIYQTSAVWRETRYTYDALDRPLSVNIYDENDGLMASESYVYDVVLLNGEVVFKTAKTVLGDSSMPTSETFEYKDVYGRTVRSGGMFDGEELAKSFTYDNLDRLLTETDELGKTAAYTYDYAGNVLTETNALGATVTYTYDSMGNILTMKDAKNTTVTYTYDVLGRKLTQTVPFTESTAQVTKYAYDANGNVTEVRLSRDASTYTKTVNTYDSMNRLTKTESYDGTAVALTTEYTYNAYDKPLTMTAGTSTTTYEYNLRGEQTEITDALNQNETFLYDLGGNLVSKTDRNGTTFTYVYDRMGRLLSETAENGTQTEQRVYAYSLTGALISESNGTVTVTRKYDVLGRLIEETETSADGTAVSRYAYTVRSEKERFAMTWNGEEILSEYYEYDDVGRLWKVYDSTAVWTIDDGVYDPTADFSSYPELPIYTIAARGYYEDGLRYRLVPLASETHPFTLTYGNYGVCFEEEFLMVGTVGGGSSVISVYDGDEIVEQYHVLFNGGLGTVLYGYYVYDENETVIQSIAVVAEDFDGEYPIFELMVLDDHIDFDQYTAYSMRASTTERLITTYSYDANGNRILQTNANGTSTTYLYNKANLVTTVVNKQGDTILSGHGYTYALDGNIISETTDGVTTVYIYDGLGRLTSESKNGTIISYTYDANGNRATMTKNGVTTTYTYDANNRLLTESKAGDVILYQYDANGNTLRAVRGGDGVGAYTYNLFGNQVSYTPTGVVFTSYTYRPDGLRHSIGNTVHLWDGENIVADIVGNSITTYIRGLTLLYANDENEIYYHFNAHGDVVVLTDEDGTKEKSYSYNAFGVEEDPSALDDNPFRYCGEYFDKVNEKIYLRARYYDAGQGRFTQEDPIRDGSNWYSYCGGNPVMFVDPSGEFFITAKWATRLSWLPAIDLHLPIGDILYVIGLLFSLTIDIVNFINYVGVDNIVNLLANGKQAFQNTIEKLAQDFNNNTTNPPDPSNLPDPDDKWDIHNLKPGDTWVNGQVYNDVINKAHHIFENPTHDHRLDDLLKSFNGDVLKAYESMTKTAQDYINKIGLTNENFYGIDYNFNINGYNMTLRLTNIDGYVRVVTAFIKK